jgi:folate-binding protein YgfZ
MVWREFRTTQINPATESEVQMPNDANLYYSPLRASLLESGAELSQEGGVEFPVSFGSVESEYWALKESAGLIDLSHRGRLQLSGPDAPRFLHGMSTNEVKGLGLGQGNHAFFLNAHGHILSDARVFRFAEQEFLIDCDPQRVGQLRESLEKHIIADQVEVRDVRSTLSCLAVEGPTARELLRQAVGFEPPNLQPLESMLIPEEAITGDRQLRLARSRITKETGFWLWGVPERLSTVWQKAVEVGLPLGAMPVGMDAVEICRIEAGVPKCGAEIIDKTLVQETHPDNGLGRAVSFTKGCYIGQEIVERVRSRGNVHRQLIGLLFDGPQHVETGAEVRIMADTGYVHAGTVTSVTYSFAFHRTIALAMLHRDHSEPGKVVEVGGLSAEISPVPFFFPTARY